MYEKNFCKTSQKILKRIQNFATAVTHKIMKTISYLISDCVQSHPRRPVEEVILWVCQWVESCPDPVKSKTDLCLADRNEIPDHMTERGWTGKEEKMEGGERGPCYFLKQ